MANPRVAEPDLIAVEGRLAKAGCIAPREEGEKLACAARGDAAALERLVARRLEGEPLAWLTGQVDFCGLTLSIAPGVYVPRPQTEALARRAAALLPQRGVGVDLCTGAGAVAAVLAAAEPAARVVATELDPEAARCARSNGVETLEGHLDEPLPGELEGRVDVLTAVVPYVPTASLSLLPRDVQAFEPRLALDGGADGTELLLEVARRAPRWLRSRGWLLLELGGDQADAMRSPLSELGFGPPEVIEDEDGDPRGICAQLS